MLVAGIAVSLLLWGRVVSFTNRVHLVRARDYSNGHRAVASIAEDWI